MGIIVTNSKIKTFQRCSRQFMYKFQKGLAQNTPGLPLKRGSWMHELFQAHYTGEDWVAKHEELTAEYMKLFDEEREMYGNLPEECERIMRSYLFHWRHEDTNMKILGAEQEFITKLPHGHRFGGKYDLIAEDEYGIWLWEHKTHKTYPKSDYRFLDVQTARYVWSLRREGINVSGVLWNYCRTKPPTIPRINKDGRMSKRKIDTDVLTFVRFLKQNGLQLSDHRDRILALQRSDSFYRRERVPVVDKVIATLVKEAVVTADTIERGFIPVRSVQRSCEHDCSYRALCISDLYGGNTAAIIRAKYHVRKEGEYYGDEFPEEA